MQKFKLNKGENYHIEAVSGGLKIRFTQNGKIYVRTLSGSELSVATTDRVADECVTLYDGAQLVRNYQNISVLTEES